MANTHYAVLLAADPDNLAECPHPRVTLEKLSYGEVKLVGDYDDLMQVLINFIGMTAAEADILIEEV